MDARITGHVEPASFTAGHVDNSYAACRVFLADLRILDRIDPRIEGIGIVHEWKLGYALRIELPVSDCIAVGAEAKAVAQTELFLVDPVECAIDLVRRGRIGEPGDVVA